jgi:hypothetical protein
MFEINEDFFQILLSSTIHPLRKAETCFTELIIPKKKKFDCQLLQINFQENYQPRATKSLHGLNFYVTKLLMKY